MKNWMLIGELRLEILRPAFAKALNILNKMPVERDLIKEHEAENFSQHLAQEIAEHGKA